MKSLLETAVRLEQEGVPFALVTVLRTVAPTSAHPGDKAVVTPEGKFHGWVGGGCAQRHIVRAVRAALADGKTRQIRVVPEDEVDAAAREVEEFASHCPSRGTLELLIDPVPARPQLVVLGDSPVASSLSALAPQLGFDVTVAAIDAQASDFPEAAAVYPVFAADTLRERVKPGADVVVATQGKLDVIALKTALSLGARHVSFVASLRKATALKADLRKEGLATADIEAIVAPAGLDISARTPAEIALSVLAYLVALRRGSAAVARAPATSITAPAPLAAVSGGGARR
ncbi:MAG: XdhC family protein [Hyphomicrobiaceae bacterium]